MLKKGESDDRCWKVSIGYYLLWNNKYKDDFMEVVGRMFVFKRG